MIAIIIFIGIIIGLNCIPLLTKKTFPKVEKITVRILLVATILLLTTIFLDFNGYKLKSNLAFRIIGLSFIISTFIYFAIFKNTREKIWKIIFLTVLIIVSLMNQVLYEKLGSYEIADELNMTVSREGFLACGEIIRITKSEFGIFEKELFYDSNQCLIGITKIETVEFNENGAEFLIYHNGIYDNENPYKYEIENKNVW
jgi:ABC-2 type transport system permease protein